MLWKFFEFQSLYSLKSVFLLTLTDSKVEDRSISVTSFLVASQSI